MASVKDTLDEINAILKQSTDGPYKSYSCKTVSWDDVQRGTVGGNLSCWGANITDTRLHAKDGRQLFTVRGDNWNERLGKVTVDDLALIASDADGGGESNELRPVTLRTLLQNISKYGRYANLELDAADDAKGSLLDEKLDEEVSVRFQTTFLPVEEGDKKSLEFAPEAYNYNTTDDEDPRNIILLCTTQGLAIQQDGKGSKKLFHHAKVDGRVQRYWLETESSSHKVGGSQVETAEEKADALERGKATSAVIGTKGIGTRFNVLMTIQVPLEQKKKPIIRQDFSFGSFGGAASSPALAAAVPFGSSYYASFDKSAPPSPGNSQLFGSAPPLSFGTRRRGGGKMLKMRKKGTSSAARVSKGTMVENDFWTGLTVKHPKRHPNEHITATIVMYYTCSGGVPSAEDVKSAIDDLEDLYRAIEVNGKLSDDKFDFMKSELTVKDALNIHKKLKTQPPKPSAPLNADIFPSSH